MMRTFVADRSGGLVGLGRMRGRWRPGLLASTLWLGSLCVCASADPGAQRRGDGGGPSTADPVDAQVHDGGSAELGPAREVGTEGAGDGPSVSTSCRETACAFPGAEGFGTETGGGRGGPVLVVTTLAGAGPGSIRAAMLTAGPRIVVFAVSGVIDLAGADIALLEQHSRLTVLGQSSPGGITLVNGGISSYHAGLHDVILRFLRVRGGTNADNISIAGVRNLVIDHCDFSGATDEAFDVTFAQDFTVQWSTVTNSVRGMGSQNYGSLIAYRPTTNISLHHNLSAHHAGRCGAQFHWAGDGPAPPDGAAIDLRNNVFYNCGFQQIYRADMPPPAGNRWNLVGNFAIAGPNTPPSSMIFGLSGRIFLDDNQYPGHQVLSPYFAGTMLDQPHAFPWVTTTPSTEAREQVLARAGSWPRDAMNLRTVAEVRAGAGGLGKHDDPLAASGPPPPQDADLDGIADDWEAAHGLDPDDRLDSAKLHGSGYAFIEVYLNELAERTVGR